MGEKGTPAGRAFICYAREDGRKVDDLQKKLESAGIQVWRDTTDLLPGQTDLFGERYEEQANRLVAAVQRVLRGHHP